MDKEDIDRQMKNVKILSSIMGVIETLEGKIPDLSINEMMELSAAYRLKNEYLGEISGLGRVERRSSDRGFLSSEPRDDQEKLYIQNIALLKGFGIPF